jgi:protein-disulfide isomerase
MKPAKQAAAPVKGRREEGVPPDRVAGYVFLLATVGLAAVFYFAYASFFVLKQACPLCMTMYVSVLGVFLISAGAASSLKDVPTHLGRDLAAVPRSQTGTTIAVAWLAASIALLVLFPKEAALSAAEPSVASSDPDVPIETLTPEQLAEWAMTLDGLPRKPEMAPQGPVKVRVVKFNDYQCPYCRQTWALYRGILAKYEAAHPEAFEYESRDFPLESECGAGGGHSMSCEAAAAARMARARNREREMEAWLFEHQSFEMTRDDVKKGLTEIVQAADFEAEYPKVLPAIREDVQLAQKVGVNSTPTFFINGIQFGALRPAYFDAAIAWALRKEGVTPQSAGTPPPTGAP